MPQRALKLNGKPLQLRPVNPTTQKLKDFLDKSPPDELLTTSELGARVSAHTSTIAQESIFGSPLLQGCTVKVGQTRYWGNPKAITELLKQVGHEG